MNSISPQTPNSKDMITIALNIPMLSMEHIPKIKPPKPIVERISDNTSILGLESPETFKSVREPIIIAITAIGRIKKNRAAQNKHHYIDFLLSPAR